jgi:hypothetical protein
MNHHDSRYTVVCVPQVEEDKKVHVARSTHTDVTYIHVVDDDIYITYRHQHTKHILHNIHLFHFLLYFF